MLKRFHLQCSMPGCEAFRSSPAEFVVHMHQTHGVNISVEDLLWVLNHRPRRAYAKREATIRPGVGEERRKGHSPAILAKITEMTMLRQSGLTLAQIGEKFGVTRERVRQLIESMPRPQKPKPWPRTYFARIMKQWLWDAGYRRCSTCNIWSEDFHKGSRVCAPCARQWHKEHYHNGKGKAYMQQYRRDHPEVARRAARNWGLRHPEQAREARRRAYQKLISTEDAREYVRRKGREAYWRRKEREHRMNTPIEPVCVPSS